MSDTTKTCPCCEKESETVSRRRRNTNYCNDELNWLESCQECYQQDCEYYAEMWADYYRGRL